MDGLGEFCYPMCWLVREYFIRAGLWISSIRAACYTCPAGRRSCLDSRPVGCAATDQYTITTPTPYSILEYSPPVVIVPLDLVEVLKPERSDERQAAATSLLRSPFKSLTKE